MRALAPGEPIPAGVGQGPVATETHRSCFLYSAEALRPSGNLSGPKGESSQLSLTWELLSLTLKTFSLKTGDILRVPNWTQISGLPKSQQRTHKVENLPISTKRRFFIYQVG